MQAVNHEQPIPSIILPATLRISSEFVAYVVLIILALLLRVADLDIVPMNDVEAMQALAAYQVVYAETPTQAHVAPSPVVFWLQTVSFAVLGGDELASRLPGVIGGIVLILMPLLFRSRIGRERAFWMAALLAFSPIGFAAGRFADPAIWTIIFALGSMWSVWRYWDSRNQADVLLAAGLIGAMAFLAESGGLLLALILTLSGFVAVWWTVLDAPQERDTPGDEIWDAAREFVNHVPLTQFLIVLVLTVVLGSTLFFAYPAGFDSVAEVVRGFFAGFIQLYQPGTPPIMGILTLFVYDLWLVILAVVAAVVLVVNRQVTFVDRFAIAASVIAFAVVLVYRGSHPAYALYVAVPMMWLSARLTRELTRNIAPIIFSYDGFLVVEDDDAYWWIKWVIAVLIMALLLSMVFHVASLGQGLLAWQSIDLQSFAQLAQAPFFQDFSRGLMWTIISIVFLLIGYFLAASVCGHTNSLQGFGIGLLLFMLGAGIGTGWNIAVVNASNPHELWHNTATTPDAYLLRDTLLEVADRDTYGFPLISISVLTDETIGLTDDGLIAWLLRDFQNAEFVDSLDDVQRAEIVLMPVLEEDPDLGGSYVGQSFLIRQGWSLSSLQSGEVVSWLTQRRVNNPVVAQNRAILWLRIDVYDDIPASERIRG